MNRPKYSQLENERRFLVPSLVGVSLDESSRSKIDDLYIVGTRLRLRTVVAADGSIFYKLCKKYPSDDEYSGAIVNTYLTEQEWQILAALPARPICKLRYPVDYNGTAFSVNVFAGQLNGLILCEAEQPTRTLIRSLAFPAWATKDVTADVFFTGGRLSQVTAEQLRQKLASLNL